MLFREAFEVMNKLSGKISDIKSIPGLSLVSINVAGFIFTSIVLDTPDDSPYLKKENPINVLFKETEVSICADFINNLSIRNQLPVEILEIEKGELLSRIKLKFQESEIASVITTGSVERLDLQRGKKVFALVKTNEVMLSEK